MKPKTGECCQIQKLPAILDRDGSGSVATLLSNLPGAVYCCRNDAGATVEFVSAIIREISGYAPEDLMGKAMSWLQLVHPADKSSLRQAVKNAVSKREPWSLEYRIRAASGAERWIWDHGRGVFDGDEVVCLQGFVSDVTDRRQAEATLRRSEEKFRATFENAAVGIAHVGLDGRWLCVNHRLCEIVGYTYEELRQKTFGDITHPEDIDADWEQARQLIEGTIPSYSFEKRYFRKDGSIVWVKLTGSLVRNEDSGKPDYFIAVVEDIERRIKAETDLRKRTAEAEERATQLRALASEMIHAEDRERRRIAQLLHDELQQLLVAANFSLQRVRKQTDGEAAGDVEQAQSLIANAIEESRSLTSELSPRCLHSEGLLAALQWLAGWMKDKHGLTVSIHCDDRPEPANQEMAVLLFQAVRELLFNVVKHAGVHEASVSLEKENGLLRIKVEDHGSGFSPPGDHRSPGGGFGHFAIRERLAMIGGRFEIDSAPGQGTRATLEAQNRVDGTSRTAGSTSK